MTAKPLLLKDYLDLKCESAGGGFYCYPRHGAAVAHEFQRCESRRPPLAWLKAKIFAVVKLRLGRAAASGSTPSLPFSLSRSLTKRLSGNLWRRRGEENDETMVPSSSVLSSSLAAVAAAAAAAEVEEEEKDQAESPVVSSCRSWSASYADSSSAAASGIDGSSLRISERVADQAADGDQGGADDDIKEAMEKEREQEQQSPTAVMNFPSDEDDDATSSSRTVEDDEDSGEVRHKGRHFPRISDVVPVDLGTKFVALDEGRHFSIPSNTGDLRPSIRKQHGECDSNDEDDECQAILDLLWSATPFTGEDIDAFQRLILDLSQQQLDGSAMINGWCAWRKTGQRRTEPLKVAMEWIGGRARGPEEAGMQGEVEVEEMENCGQWRHFCEDMNMVGEEVEEGMINYLFDELIEELLWIDLGSLML